MRRIVKFLWLLGLALQMMSVQAAPAKIESLQFAGKQNRVVFELRGNPQYHFFTLRNPSRLVVDFSDTVASGSIAQPPGDHPLAVEVRSARRNTADYRVVVELNNDVLATPVTANNGHGLRLQFDLAELKSAPHKTSAKKTSKAAKKPQVKAVKLDGRDIIVAIDAGHGGKDVGAQGSHGTREKDVVLAIAKRLEAAVNRQPGMKAVMIRDGDYFVKLSQRVRKAREAKADLFVSIHADAFDDPSANGASVYTLANKGASSRMAQYLANSENASDRAGGVTDIQDDTLASVLMDLSNKAAKEASQHIGNKVLRNIKTVGHLHRSNVQKAGFVVLKSPIPSILVETAFISNPEEERRLNSSVYQDKMAAALFKGIEAHFKRYAPANTLFAQLQKAGKSRLKVASRNSNKTLVDSQQTKHVISRGDTLSSIARQYGVSMREIRSVNGMQNVTVKIGQVLQIPHSS